MACLRCHLWGRLGYNGITLFGNIMSHLGQKPRPRPRQPAGVQETRVLKIVCVFALLALLWLVFTPETGLVSLMKKRSELHKMQEEVALIEQQIKILESDIDRLQNDPGYLEELGRMKYNLLKKNEELFDFTRPKRKKKK